MVEDNTNSEGGRTDPHAKVPVKRKALKRNNLLQLIFILAGVALANYIISYFPVRFDLTAEGRYTLSDKTIEMVENLDDVVFVKVYLDGELPYGFQRLQNAVREMLDELRVYAGENIGYEFINPSEDPDPKNRKQIYAELDKRGLDAVNLQEKDAEGGVSQKVVFPGAIITYHDREAVINMLKGGSGLTPDQALNGSIQDLEYELSNAIRRVIATDFQKIGFIEGHGELDRYQVGDITKSLAQYYYVDRIRLSGHLSNIYEIEDYSALIVAKPDSAFSEQDKFILDQYIMNGGKILWLLDFIRADIDSLSISPSALGYFDSGNLEEQIFRYGARINANLVMDIRCDILPVPGDLVGAQTKWAPGNWYYYPVIFPENTSPHPIVKNIDAIKLEFPAYIDTVGLDPLVKKTVLLRTSPYTKVVNTPARIFLGVVQGEPDKRQFNRKEMPVAVLLEGEFESNFRNKSPELLKQIEQIEGLSFRDRSKRTKMIVVADGDIIRNEVSMSADKTYSLLLGQNRFYPDMRYYEGNKQFLLNAVNYLCDDDGLMSVRSRELKLRMLDKVKILEGRMKWQLINTILPIISVIVFGLIVSFIRRKRYSG